MERKRATIYEVAERAGVSHQTVSRYLRQNGGLKPATVARVQAAVEELNYRPNLAARSMRTRRTGRIAILLPTATQWAPLRLLNAASGAAHEAGYTVELVSLEGGALDRAARAQELADSGEFEGILALASLGDQPTSQPSTSLSGTPVVITADYDDEMHGLGALADGERPGTSELPPPRRSSGLRLGPQPTADLRRHDHRTQPEGGRDRVRLVGAVRVRGGDEPSAGHRHHRGGGRQRCDRDGCRTGQPDSRVEIAGRSECLRLG
jgi:hypothetical protein